MEGLEMRPVAVLRLSIPRNHSKLSDALKSYWISSGNAAEAERCKRDFEIPFSAPGASASFTQVAELVRTGQAVALLP